MNPKLGFAALSAALAAGVAWLLVPKPKETGAPKPTAPPPPPQEPPPAGVQGLPVQRGKLEWLGTTYLYTVWRLFVWNNGQWQLEDTEEQSMDAAIKVRAPWPLLIPGFSESPPYYYSDSWTWDQKWIYNGCDTSFHSSWCG